MYEIKREIVHPDGTIEVFSPSKNKDGMFVLAKKTTDDPLHHEPNRVLVSNFDEMVRLLQTGEYHLRMKSEKSPVPSLISPKNIEIIESPQS